MSEAEPLAVIDFLTHSRIRIAADPAAIWPIVIDSKREGAEMPLLSIEGEKGSVGERFKSVLATDPDTPLYFVTNAEVVPQSRRTIRLESVDGVFWGFATWTLTPHGDETELTYDVYCRYPGLPAGQSHADFMAGFQDVMDAGLARMKAIVEAAQ
jgi:hypothetical protein